MRLYDWFIIALIGALIAGAYFALDAIPPTSPLFSDPAKRDAWAFELFRNIALGFAGFVAHLLIFRGRAATLRSAAGSAMLLFLVAIGLQIFSRYLLFIGWVDDGSLQSRQQLLGIADWLSGGILMLSAAAFVLTAILGLARRLGWGGGA